MSDRIAVMRSGRLEQVGTPEEIYDGPTTAFVARFIGSANLMPVVVEGTAGGRASLRLPGAHRGEAPTGALRFAAGEAALLMVRPERLEVRTGEPRAGARRRCPHLHRPRVPGRGAPLRAARPGRRRAGRPTSRRRAACRASPRREALARLGARRRAPAAPRRHDARRRGGRGPPRRLTGQKETPRLPTTTGCQLWPSFEALAMSSFRTKPFAATLNDHSPSSFGTKASGTLILSPKLK